MDVTGWTPIIAILANVLIVPIVGYIIARKITLNQRTDRKADEAERALVAFGPVALSPAAYAGLFAALAVGRLVKGERI